jgi:CRISPR system Cascade subunit CasC
MTTFVQIHTLRDYGPSLPNRGADGLAKRCHYGDAERQRISSQCIKAALREPTLGLAQLAAELGLDMSVRSGAAISRVLGPDLESRGMPKEDAKAYAKGVASAFVKEGGTVEDDGKLSQPIVVGGTELRLLADIAEALQSKEIGADEVRNVLAKPSSARKAGVEDIIASMHATNANAGIDGALFGRFATGVALHTVDGCVDVAHALTTHQIQSVADFFSAQDQLLEADEAGAAHIGTVELTTALYYNYAVVNVDQLSKNIASLDVNQRAQLIAWIVRAFATVEPAAKRGSTAPYSELIDLVVEVGERQPVSYVGAFRQAIRPCAGEDIADLSKTKLTDHMTRLDGIYGGPGQRFCLANYEGRPDRPALTMIDDDVITALAGAEAE